MTNFNTRNYILDTNCPIVPTGNSKKIAPLLFTVLEEILRNKYVLEFSASTGF